MEKHPSVREKRRPIGCLPHVGSWVSVQPAGQQNPSTWDLKLAGAEPPSVWWSWCSLEGRTPGIQTPLRGSPDGGPPTSDPLSPGIISAATGPGEIHPRPRARPSCLLGLSNEARPRLEALLLFIPSRSYLISTQTQLFSRVYVTPPSSPQLLPGAPALVSLSPVAQVTACVRLCRGI